MPDVFLFLLSVFGSIFSIIFLIIKCFELDDDTPPLWLLLGLLVLPLWLTIATKNRALERTEEVEPIFLGNDVVFKVNNNYENGYKFFKRTITKDDKIYLDYYSKWSNGVYFIVDEPYVRY